MRKLLLPLLIILLFTSCKKVIITDKVQEEIGSVAARGPGTKIEICHDGNTISINSNAWPAHLAHGDIQGDCSVATITICDQTWMVKNLDVDHYRNGDPIPQVTDLTEWIALTTGAWCYYGNTSTNGTTYGKLYNWYAVNDSRGLAPEGWHVPSEAEWTTLTTCLGGDAVAGGKMKSVGNIEAATGLWYAPNTDATNSSGFTGHPGGYRIGIDAPFNNFELIGSSGFWWTSTEFDIWARFIPLVYFAGTVLRDPPILKTYGFSVRCVKD